MDRRVSNGATSAEVQSDCLITQARIGQAPAFELAKTVAWV